MSGSPTSRSKKALEDAGYKVAIVEHWNPWARIRQDLFGCIDLLALRDEETLAVQVTSGSNHSARVKKLSDHENLPWMRKAGWRIVVQSWRKNAQNKWVMRETDVS